MNINKVELSGLAILCEVDQDNCYAGYFLSNQFGIFKLMLKECQKPPSIHDCCRPNSLDNLLKVNSTEILKAEPAEILKAEPAENACIHGGENACIHGGGHVSAGKVHHQNDHKTSTQSDDHPAESNNTGSSLFWDLTLKQLSNVINVKACQNLMPGGDALNFSTDWTSDVMGRHDEFSSASFVTHVVKVGSDAQSIVEKHFPFMQKPQEGTVVLGFMNASYSTIT